MRNCGPLPADSDCIGNSCANYGGQTCVAAPLSTMMWMESVGCSALPSCTCAIMIGSWQCTPETIWIVSVLSVAVVAFGAGNACCCG